MKIIFQRLNQNFSVSSTLKKGPRVDGGLFLRMKNRVLGQAYELGVVFVGKELGRKLNRKHRKKNYATDILSFALDKNAGEIFIQPAIAERKAAKFGRKPKNYLSFLVIHGLFHLKGMVHGSKMEAEEARVRASFKI